MNFVILICTIVIFRGYLAQNVNPLDAARAVVYLEISDVTTNYSNIFIEDDYSNLLNQINDVYINIQNQSDEASQQIRLQYDEFYANLSMGYGMNSSSECYYHASLSLNVDVLQPLDNLYKATTVYTTILSDLQTLVNTDMANGYYSIVNNVYTQLYDANVTVELIEIIGEKFKADAIALFKHINAFIEAVATEIDNLFIKFNEETIDRVTNTLAKINTIKEYYENCILYGYL